MLYGIVTFIKKRRAFFFKFESSATVLKETKISRETFLAYINTCRIVTVLLNEVDLALIITIIFSTKYRFLRNKNNRFFDSSFRLTRDQNIQVYRFFFKKINKDWTCSTVLSIFFQKNINLGSCRLRSLKLSWISLEPREQVTT